MPVCGAVLHASGAVPCDGVFKLNGDEWNEVFPSNKLNESFTFSGSGRGFSEMGAAHGTPVSGPCASLHAGVEKRCGAGLVFGTPPANLMRS